MNTDKLVQCFAKALGIPELELMNNLAYGAVQGWDSVGHMALVAAIEAEFDVVLDTDDIIAMSSLGKAKEILSKYGVPFDASEG